MAVNALKDLGNKSFATKDYDKAIHFFTAAIAIDPSNYVLYSNRSAANAGKKLWSAALEDAEKCVTLNPSWGKGYGRKGAALHGARRYGEAAAAYEMGIRYEDSPALRKGLQEVKDAQAKEPGIGPDLGHVKLSQDPNLIGKLATNPRTREHPPDPAFVQKQNHRLVESALGSDPRMIDVLGVEMAPKPEKEVVELSEDDAEEATVKADALADKGKDSEHYTQRRFDDASAAFSKAWDHWPKDITCPAAPTNLGAVHFKQGEYEERIETCEMVVEEGQSHRTDFKFHAKGFGRISSAYSQKGEFASAKKYFQKSVVEHRDAATLSKLQAPEKAEAQRQAYIDPAKSAAAREEGNVAFKAGDFAGAVRLYTESIKRDPSDVRGYSNRAAAYMKLMSLTEALKDAEEAIKVDPSFVKAHDRKASILHSMREHSKAHEATPKSKSFKDAMSDSDRDSTVSGEFDLDEKPSAPTKTAPKTRSLEDAMSDSDSDSMVSGEFGLDEKPSAPTKSLEDAMSDSDSDSMDFGDFDLDEKPSAPSKATPKPKSDFELKDAMIIAVMGATGAGKSQFIRTLSGDDSVVVGNNLKSETVDVNPVWCLHPESGKEVILLDTPGFADTERTDADILLTIANWLKETYEKGIKLAGILYLHRISDNRVTNVSVTNLRMLEELCGTDSLKNVIFVTTMWGKEDKAIAEGRQAQLEQTFWASMIKLRAQVARFGDTHDDGWSIIDKLKSRTPRPLKLQKEMVDEKKELADTAAGAEVEHEMKRLIAEHEAKMKQLTDKIEKTRIAGEAATQAALEKEQRAEAAVKRAEEAVKNAQTEAAKAAALAKLELATERAKIAEERAKEKQAAIDEQHKRWLEEQRKSKEKLQTLDRGVKELYEPASAQTDVFVKVAAARDEAQKRPGFFKRVGKAAWSGIRGTVDAVFS